MEPFEFTDTEMADPRMCGRTFVHNGVPVLVIRVSDGTVPDEVFEACMTAFRRFVTAQKQTPFRYHLVMDLHRTLSLPMDRMVAINTYLARKERVLRPSLASTTYLVQGRLAANAVEAMFTMFGMWGRNHTVHCHPDPATDGAGHGIPDAVSGRVFEFMDNEAPRKGR